MRSGTKIGLVSVLVLSGFCAEARAEWVNITGSLPEVDLIAVAASPANASRFAVSTARHVYMTKDGGSHWSQVLTVRGETNRVHRIYFDARSEKILWVASDQGLQVSRDDGRTWKYAYRATHKKAKPVYVLADDVRGIRKLWVGTGAGLYRMDPANGTMNKIFSLPEAAVHAILLHGDREILVGTDRGIYQSIDSGKSWKNVYSERREKTDASEATLSQFAIEELTLGSSVSGLIYHAPSQTWMGASSRGLLRAEDPTNWRLAPDGLPDRNVNDLATSGSEYFIATDKGVVKAGSPGSAYHDLSDGLPSKQVQGLFFEGVSGNLLAATSKGVFRYPQPSYQAPSAVSSSPLKLDDVLARFKNEPTVLEVQEAAIRYAEVHPDKIKAWREAASRKAWLPTLSFSVDSSSDQNVDLDRGGTNDPDRFIIGPEEESDDLHVGLSWDLGDTIWNDDQTSIDTRSKLMAELRDDVLNDVTHLYFERRRMQAQMILDPANELPLQVERELKLQELTAGLDALTGGYFSQRLAEAAHAGYLG